MMSQEAWATGLPVAASDVGGLGRLCAAHPDAAAVFPPLDAAALDAAIARARRDGETMSAAGRIAAAEYDWSALSRRLLISTPKYEIIRDSLWKIVPI